LDVGGDDGGDDLTRALHAL